MSLSAVILAGGQSKRMGREKAWVRYEGKPLIQAAVEKIRSLSVDQVFISAREDQDYSHLNCRVLFDLEPGLGPLSGIERALRESVSPLVLVLPVDLPRMTAECLNALAQSCDRFSGAIAKVNSELQPLVAVYPKRCHAYAVNGIARGDYAVHQFASACLHEKAIKLFRVPPWQADCFKNCNAPEDLLASAKTVHT
jgi:molybdopterin-guanine dinucleotide biosynthesis protein A